jgi:hypothetical protein
MKGTLGRPSGRELFWRLWKRRKTKAASSKEKEPVGEASLPRLSRTSQNIRKVEAGMPLPQSITERAQQRW